MVKYVTLPLLAVIGLVRLIDRRQRRGLAGVIGAWTLDGVAILLVIVAAFAPFWAGFDTLTQMLLEPGRLYTNPLWFDPYMLLDYLFPHRVADIFSRFTRTGMQLASIGIIAWVLIRFGRDMWQFTTTGKVASGLDQTGACGVDHHFVDVGAVAGEFTPLVLDLANRPDRGADLP
jgi:hypothetical protein